MIWRQEMDIEFLAPTYEAWLSESIAAGHVKAPGWNDPILRAAWLNHSWTGLPMLNIDPKRTADADKTYVELGALSLDDLAKQHNGSSGPKNRAINRKAISELTPLPTGKTGGANGSTVGG